MYLKNTADDDQPLNSPIWLVSYTDLLSLILTFFVMLVAFYRPQTSQLNKMAASMSSTLSNGRSDETYTIASPEVLKNLYEGMRKKAARKGQLQGFRHDADIRTVDNAVPVTHSSVVFSEGSTGIDLMNNHLLERMGVLFRRTPYTIQVQAYSDDLYSRESSAVHWELATQRSLAVARYLLDRGISAERISVAAVKEPVAGYPAGSVEILVFE